MIRWNRKMSILSLKLLTHCIDAKERFFFDETCHFCFVYFILCVCSSLIFQLSSPWNRILCVIIHAYILQSHLNLLALTTIVSYVGSPFVDFRIECIVNHKLRSMIFANTILSYVSQLSKCKSFGIRYFVLFNG